MTLKEIQKEVDVWINSVGVRYFNELTNLAILNEEVGELSRIIARVYGEQSFKVQKSEEEKKRMIEDEIGDIFFVLTCLSNQMNIDLEAAYERGVKKRNRRDGERHKNNEKLQ